MIYLVILFERPLLSVPLLSAELDYPLFLRPKFSMPNFYEVQSDLYYLHLYYLQTLVIHNFEAKIQYAQVLQIIEV